MALQSPAKEMLRKSVLVRIGATICISCRGREVGKRLRGSHGTSHSREHRSSGPIFSVSPCVKASYSPTVGREEGKEVKRDDTRPPPALLPPHKARGLMLHLKRDAY
eukprot:scaffold1725_cov195-Alexandrium_tamarense.AAC.15